MSRSANELIRQRSADFKIDLNAMAERFMRRRGSTTLDTTDVDATYAWLTRPPRKAAARDVVASVVVFLAAAVMAFGINLLTGGPPRPAGVWVIVGGSAALAAFAEVFRRWAYE